MLPSGQGPAVEVCEPTKSGGWMGPKLSTLLQLLAVVAIEVPKDAIEDAIKADKLIAARTAIRIAALKIPAFMPDLTQTLACRLTAFIFLSKS